MDYLEAIFAVLFLNYFFYQYTFLYNLIPMLIEIIFLYFIQRKNLLKITITIFLSQGIVLGITGFIYDIVYQIHDIRNTPTLPKFWNTIKSSDFIFNIGLSLLLFIILVLINYLVYRDEITKNSYKQLIYLISGALINSIVLLLIMIKFPKPFQF
ncbi:hypothetical protein [Hathewaya histolytica]|uniref:hypothetical protein n=1 Tax=Hathewaya histolytica TaxID=1498 RepID=UPI0010FE4FD9|nr:hypothetical protein [Hathewaya histolytica]